MNILMFYLFASIIVVFSILTVTSRRVLRAAVYLLFVLISTAGLYFLLNYMFLAAVQLALYAGGIVVLIIFSILLTSHINEKFEPVSMKKGLATAFMALTGAGLSIFTIAQHSFPQVVAESEGTSVKTIGRALLNYGENGYVLPFEVISILLLAAMFGAIVIAKKKQEQQ